MAVIPRAGNPARMQARANYLSRVRPNDAEIPRIQNRIQAANAATNATGTTPPADDTTATTTTTTTTNPPAQAQANTGRIQNRINFLKRTRPGDPEIAKLEARMKAGANTTPPAATTTTTPPPVTAPAQPAFRSASDFLQGNVADSPLYKQRLDESQRALNAKLAAMGLSNSGAAIQQDVGLVNRLTAEETERAREMAQFDASRFDNLSEATAARRERAGQDQVNNTLRLAELLLGQNPMGVANEGLNKYNSTRKEKGANRATAIRATTPLQTGGTGVPPPVFDPGYAGSPDFSGINVMQPGFDMSGANDIIRFINSFYATNSTN